MARGLNWQTVQLSLGGGVETGSDVRAADPRQMDIARDLQFDELLGVQTRKPITSGVFGANNIFGGGTLSNCRRLETVNGELVLFTDVGVYSWNAQLSAWVLRGTHLAVSLTETPRFVTTGDQVDGDRAELNGTVVYAWTEGTAVYAAAMDKVTGSVLVSPTALSTAVGRPRFVALDTKILLFVDAGASNLTVRSIDPAAPGAAIAGAGTSVIAGAFNLYYDVGRVDGQDLAVGACRRSTTTSYSVFTVTSAAVVTAATKARTCDGPIAVATIPGGTKVQIARVNTLNAEGDLLTTSTLADIFAAQALGTTAANQITLAFSTVPVGGQFVATVFWDFQEVDVDTLGQARTKSNTVTTGNAVGPGTTIARMLGPASRAFAYAGRVYVWFAFAGLTAAAGTATPILDGIAGHYQNTYFLYRDDGVLISKAVFDRAGGFSPSIGHLPEVGVISATGFAWCGSVRRAIELEGIDAAGGFAARILVDVAFAFDSNDARRSAQLGQTLYVSGGMPVQYDGDKITEVGFLTYPYALLTIGFALSPGAGLLAGIYSWKATYRALNARGEQERSTTATSFHATAPGGPGQNIAVGIAPLVQTLKAKVAAELWRTKITPGPDSPYYLATSKDPNATGENGYVANSPGSGVVFATDGFSDAVLTTKELNPENGTVLEVLAPPGARIAIATDTRLFLAGVAGQPDAVWYSRQREDGEIAGFNDTLVALVPPAGGDITALAFLNETLVVFRETAVYAMPGQGFDNAGGGQNLGPANRLSADVGAIGMETVVLTPMGLVFKSSKGWYLLDRGWQVQYVGSAIAKFDGDTVVAAHIVETQHQIRILSTSRLLVWDYFNRTEGAPLGQWAEWTIADGVHATMWNGSYVYLTATGPKVEQTTYAGVTYGLDEESSWIKLADLQGAARVRWIEVLGEYRSACLVRIRTARDYQYDGAGNVVYYDDIVWAPSPTTVGSALQIRHSVTQGQCEALKVRITAVAAGARATLATVATIAVATSGTMWAAIFNVFDFVLGGKVTSYGETGNRISMNISFEPGLAVLVDVRDHFRYDQALGRWRESLNTIGVRVVTPAGGLTVNALESAIALATSLAQVQLSDASPGKTINIATMGGATVAGAFTGGTYVAPTGEAIKLTGLGLEVGMKQGLYRRLPAAQKQ